MEHFSTGLAAAEFIAQAWIRILPVDFLRYAIAAGGVYLIVNLALARRLAGRKIRPRRPDAAQMRREIAHSLRTIAIFALSGAVFVAGGVELGLIDIHDRSSQGWAYVLLNIAALIVLHDAWFYWSHRLIHHPRLFRRAHRTHHRSHNPSPFTAYSFDPAEAVINAVYLPIALALIPSSSLAIVVFLIHMIARNVVGHCGYELFPANRSGRPIFGWLTTVTHHDLHHAQAGWNFGLYFTWWDKMMGTEHPLYAEKFAEAVGTPLDGSAVRAMRAPGATALLVAVSVASLLTLAPAPIEARQAQATPAIPDGVYATQGHGAHVKFSSCEDAIEPGRGAKLCGRMVWAWDRALLADAGFEGVELLGDFHWTGDRWEDGWLANPEDGRIYRGAITPLEDGALALKGCAFVFCRTQIWRPVADIPGCVAVADR